MCTVLLPSGVNPIAVKYISYHNSLCPILPTESVASCGWDVIAHPHYTYILLPVISIRLWTRWATPGWQVIFFRHHLVSGGYKYKDLVLRVGVGRVADKLSRKTSLVSTPEDHKAVVLCWAVTSFTTHLCIIMQPDGGLLKSRNLYLLVLYQNVSCVWRIYLLVY
jgi:hypothetical protein